VGHKNTLQLAFFAVKNPKEGAPSIFLLTVQHWDQQLSQIPLSKAVAHGYWLGSLIPGTPGC